MSRDELNNLYFEWMYQLVSNDKRYTKHLSYSKLLYLLHNTNFIYLMDMDGNRYEDGIDLRYRFAYEQGIDNREVADALDNKPCSVLEMMIALSIRIEESIMNDPDIGDRTGQWFWGMIVSLGLGMMNDSNFRKNEAIDILDRFLSREYERNGKGGLFTTKYGYRDMRDIEIWYQANLYLNEIA